MCLGELPLIFSLPVEQVLSLGPRLIQDGAQAISISAPRGAMPGARGEAAGDRGVITGRLSAPSLFPRTMETVYSAAKMGLPIIGSGGVWTKENADPCCRPAVACRWMGIVGGGQMVSQSRWSNRASQETRTLGGHTLNASELYTRDNFVLAITTIKDSLINRDFVSDSISGRGCQRLFHGTCLHENDGSVLMDCCASFFKPDRDGSNVMDLHFHVRAELSGLGRDTLPAQQINKSIHQRFRNFRQGSIDEGRTASLARVGIQGEL